MEYKVELLTDNTYQVISYRLMGVMDWEREVHFQCSLSDCEAWIRLTEGGYM